jgi:hypothetical protein
MDAGSARTTRLFVCKTRGQSSAVILADAKGPPRMMMLVSPEGQPMLNFMDEKGQVIQGLPQSAKEAKWRGRSTVVRKNEHYSFLIKRLLNWGYMHKIEFFDKPNKVNIALIK